MLPLLHALFEHLAWADAAMLAAIRSHPEASQDESLRRTLHHIILAQRFFLSVFLKRFFDPQKEALLPASLSEVEIVFRDTERDALAFVKQLDEARLQDAFESSWFQGSRITGADALMQMVMHSQFHRGQCASRLRALGGTPPTTDYIIWIKDRPAPAWS